MCDERERLIGYVYDECDAPERQEIETHLAECATCRREIAGLRSVRQDLLAWDVPEHDPVWRPLAPARPVTPAWRDLPAWAMAAAAGVMLLAGVAGGLVSHRLFAPAPTALAAIEVPAQAPAVVVPAAMGSEEQAALEARVMAALRAEMEERLRSVSQPAAGYPAVESASIDELLDINRQLYAEIVDLRSRQRTSDQRIGLIAASMTGR